MNSNNWIIVILSVLLLMLIYPESGNSQNIALVESDSAKIYEEPDSTNAHFMWAQKGDLFEIESLNDGWVGINLFAGKIRYVKLADIDIQYSLSLEQDNFSKRLKLCDDVQNILDNATEKAELNNLLDKKNADSLKSKLIDKDILSLFRESDVSAIHNTIFFECTNDSLIPISDS